MKKTYNTTPLIAKLEETERKERSEGNGAKGTEWKNERNVAKMK
jgi:hypothetical protein